jgi:hypothetical protein
MIGLSAKIHTTVDAIGLPMRHVASPGPRNDIALAGDLADGVRAEALWVAKGHDAAEQQGRHRKSSDIFCENPRKQ